MPPLLSEEEMDAMDSGNESDNDLTSTEMLKNIRDGSVVTGGTTSTCN